MTVDPICDFCSGTPVTVNYESEGFAMPGPVKGVSEGAWAACADCQALIEAEDWAKLLGRCVGRFGHQFPALGRDEVRAYVAEVHARFRGATGR